MNEKIAEAASEIVDYANDSYATEAYGEWETKYNEITQDVIEEILRKHFGEL